MNRNQYLKAQERKKKLWTKFVRKEKRKTNKATKKAINKSIKMISKEIKCGNNEIFLPYGFEILDNNEKILIDMLKQKYSFLDFSIEDEKSHVCIVHWRLK